jgi:hypothetical protein
MSNAAERPTDPLGEAAEAGYWACFFDQGRGTFTPWTKKGGMKIRVESQDKTLMEDLQRTFGGLVTRSRGPYQRQWGARAVELAGQWSDGPPGDRWSAAPHATAPRGGRGLVKLLRGPASAGPSEDCLN